MSSISDDSCDHINIKYRNELKIYKHNLKKNIIKKIDKIIDEKYPYNKYLKLTKNKKCLNFVQQVLKDHLFNHHQNLLYVISFRYKLTGKYLCIKFLHPKKFVKKIKDNFERLLKFAMKKDIKKLRVKSRINYSNKIYAETYTRIYNIIFQDSDVEFSYGLYECWSETAQDIVNKYCVYTNI
ncbi:hypothetical protein QKC54_gp0542 [Megavirus baoshan]|uniref:Uncharacterized protein n=1 Tax=Megavirus baoshan TaxID=2496520 RepID=A0A3Q8U7S2_9VIRU|nr:hypothetical protein QKC54_gp0542 [Megavirus baoshan]AZL89289.1 hypothetical protein Mb0530 [Megavirus baoshan]